MKNRTLRTSLAVAALALAAGAGAQSPGITPTTVTVGQSAAFTGPAA